MDSNGSGATNRNSGGNGGQNTNTSQGSSSRSRNRNRNRNKQSQGNSSQANNDKKFTGLDQDELKGLIINTSSSQQYDKLFEGLKVMAGKSNSHVKSTLLSFKTLTEMDFIPPMPEPSQYTTTVRGVTTEDTNKKSLLNTAWLEKTKRATKKFERYEEDLKHLFSSVEGQLSPGVKQQMKAHKNWARTEETQNTLELLTMLREYCYRDSDTMVHPMIDAMNKLTKFLGCRQDHNKDAATFIDETKARFDVLKSAGIQVWSEDMIEYTIERHFKGVETLSSYLEMEKEEQKPINDAMSELFLATVIVNGCHPRAHRNLAGVLKDSYSLGTDAYPATAPKALELLNQYRAAQGQKGPQQSGNNNRFERRDGGRGRQDSQKESETEATAFVTHGEPGRGNTVTIQEATQAFMDAEKEGEETDELCFIHFGELKETADTPTENPRSVKEPHKQSQAIAEYYHLNKLKPPKDHYASEEFHVLLSQTKGRVNQDWVLLDSQATCNCICNPRLLRNIRTHPMGDRIRIHCNAGSVLVDKIGDLPGFGPVWYQEGGLANVLSLGLVSDSHRVTLDTAIAQSFFVHKDDGTTRRFDRTPCGLYACDISDISGVILTVTTVKGQKQFYSDLDLKRAKTARKLQETLGFPSLKAYLHMIDNNLIMNCPVTRKDVLIAEDVYGINTNIVKGKTVRRRASHVREDVEPVPMSILERYREVTLGIDVYTVNGIKFLRSISRHLHFRTSRAITNARSGTLLSCIQSIVGLYASRGFVVTQIFGDNEFNCLQEPMLKWSPPVHFHGAAPDAHEPFIERDNRTSKERVRCTFTSVPFKTMPPRMIIELVNGVDYWLNNWCSSSGISQTMSPRQILTGRRLDAQKHCRFQFGDYVLAHEEGGDNSMDPRARDAIYLRPTGDTQGAMFLFDLKTARRVRRKTATLAHMTDTVIDRVESIVAKEQGSPTGITYGDAAGKVTILDLNVEPIDPADDDDDASDASYAPSTADTSEASDLSGVDEDVDEISLSNEDQQDTMVEVNTAEQSEDERRNSSNERGISNGCTANVRESNVLSEQGDSLPVDNGPVPEDVSPVARNEGDSYAPREQDGQPEGSSEYTEFDTHDNTYGSNRHDSALKDDADTDQLREGRNSTSGYEDSGNTNDYDETAHSTSNHHNGDDNSSFETHEDVDNEGTTEQPIPEAPQRELRPHVTRGHNKYGTEEGFTPTAHHRNVTIVHHRCFFTASFRAALTELEESNEQYLFIANAIAKYNNIDASLVTRQYGVKAGLKIFGTLGVEAVLCELKQLHDREVVSPVQIKDMSEEEIRKALPYLMFLKQKRCGKIKGRGCADGRSQREFISKEDSYSPTVSLHALMLTCLIDAIEGRDVATADIPGAFLQTPMPEGEVVHLKFDGPMVDILARIDPKLYTPYMVTTKSGRRLLYARADKAIYGTLRAAILFYQKLSGKLMEWGFELNPYDACTANRMIDGYQCTIVWHVDDLKISHKNPKIVTKVLNALNREFGKEAPLSVTRGRIHEYVGMTIDYSEKGKVKFSMFDYLEGILADIPDELKETRRNTPTPAASHLFQTDPEGDKLSEKEAELFHHVTAQLLFASKRAHPDLQTAISFLCTRVASPDTDDIKKLKRVIGYLENTIFIPLVLGWDSSGSATWYVDASFAVHTDMRSHTGAVLTFGQGAVVSMSTKQKINTKSSTEAEIVGVDDSLPYNLWCYYFLQWQGYMANGCLSEQGCANPAEDNNETQLGRRNILYQDNTSAIRLECNGKASSTKRTRHINIRYFLITDRVKKGEVTIEYCPTGDMVADFFTKPLQGSLFRRLRNTIMGISEADFNAYKEAYYKAKRQEQCS